MAKGRRKQDNSEAPSEAVLGRLTDARLRINRRLAQQRRHRKRQLKGRAGTGVIDTVALRNKIRRKQKELVDWFDRNELVAFDKARIHGLWKETTDESRARLLEITMAYLARGSAAQQVNAILDQEISDDGIGINMATFNSLNSRVFKSQLLAFILNQTDIPEETRNVISGVYVIGEFGPKNMTESYLGSLRDILKGKPGKLTHEEQ